MGRALLALSIVAGAGCDQVFQLQRDPGPPATPLIISPDQDSDGDSEPNGTDLCPLIPNTEIGGTVDSDRDGVGDLCDPHPQTPGDCLALFDDFTVDHLLAPEWKFQGAQVVLNGGLTIPSGPESYVYVEHTLGLTSLAIDAYIDIGENTHRAVQLMFDLAPSPLANGIACSAEDMGPSTTASIAIDTVVDGVDTPGPMQPLPGLPIGAGTDLELGWGDHGFVGQCHARLAASSTPVVAMVPAAPPPSGAVAVRTLNTGIELRSIIGYATNCP